MVSRNMETVIFTALASPIVIGGIALLMHAGVMDMDGHKGIFSFSSPQSVALLICSIVLMFAGCMIASSSGILSKENKENKGFENKGFESQESLKIRKGQESQNFSPIV